VGTSVAAVGEGRRGRRWIGTEFLSRRRAPLHAVIAVLAFIGVLAGASSAGAAICSGSGQPSCATPITLSGLALRGATYSAAIGSALSETAAVTGPPAEQGGMSKVLEIELADQLEGEEPLRERPGTWQAQAHQPGDKVEYAGAVYECIKATGASTSEAPSAGGNAWWKEDHEDQFGLVPAITKAFSKIGDALVAGEASYGAAQISASAGEAITAADTISRAVQTLLQEARTNKEPAFEQALLLIATASREQDKALLRDVSGEAFVANWSRELNPLNLDQDVQRAFTYAEGKEQPGGAVIEADPRFATLLEEIIKPGSGLPELKWTQAELEQWAQEEEARAETHAAAAGLTTTPGLYQTLQTIETPGSSGPVVVTTLGTLVLALDNSNSSLAGSFTATSAGLSNLVAVPTEEHEKKWVQQLQAAEPWVREVCRVTQFVTQAVAYGRTFTEGYQRALRAASKGTERLFGGWTKVGKLLDYEVVTKNGLGKFSKLIDPVTAVMLATELPGLVMDIINLINGTPSAEEIEQKQLEDIQKMIQGLSVQVEAGFTEMSQRIEGVAKTLEVDTELLTNAGANIDRIRQEMGGLQNKLDEVEANLFDIARTQRNEGFEEALNTDLGYSSRSPGGEALPPYNFQQAAGLFYTWGFADPFNLLSERPESEWPAHPEEAYSWIVSSGKCETNESNPLACSLNYLASVVKGQGWGPGLQAGLPNPEVWAGGAAAFAQLLQENPQYVTRPQLARLVRIEHIGDQLPPGSNGNWLGAWEPASGLAGSSVLGHALETYFEKLVGEGTEYGVASAWGPTAGASLFMRLEGEENFKLAEWAPTPASRLDAACNPCKLAEKPDTPSEPGERFVNIWNGGEEQTCVEGQTSNCIAPPLAESEETAGAAASHTTGKMNKCGEPANMLPLEGEPQPTTTISPLGNPEVKEGAKKLNPLTDPYELWEGSGSAVALGWQLGLGRPTVCYEASPNEFVLHWYWLPNQGSRVELLKLKVSGTSGVADPNIEPHQCLEELWARTNYELGHCYATGIPADGPAAEYSLKGVFEVLLRELFTEPTPSGQGHRGSDCTAVAQQVLFTTWTCGLTLMPPSALEGEVSKELEKIQRSVYSDIAPESDGEQLQKANEEPQTAAEEVNSAATLLDDFLALGAPGTLASDARLRVLTTGTEHLPDNAPPDHEIYKYFRGLAEPNSTLPSSDPLAPAIVQGSGQRYFTYSLPKSELGSRALGRARELQEVLEEDHVGTSCRQYITCNPTVQLATQADPVVAATLARLDLTNTVLEASVLEEARPINIGKPEITGAVRVGKKLRCAPGEWKANPAPTFTYKWERASGGVKAPINGANSQSYVVTEADVESTLTCVVTATNTEGSTVAESKGDYVPDAAELEVVLEQSLSSTGPFGTGELLTPVSAAVYYQIQVRNIGNAPLVVEVEDPKCAPSPPAETSGAAGTSAKPLLPTEASHYTCKAMLTQQGASLVNVAVAHGTQPPGLSFPAVTAGSNTTVASFPPPKPAVKTQPATHVGQQTITFNGSVNPSGGTLGLCKFVWWAATKATEKHNTNCQQRPAGGAAGNVAATVKGLVGSLTGETYYFEAQAADVGSGAETALGGSEKVTTLPFARPVVETTTPTAIEQRSAAAHGAVETRGAEITLCKFVYTRFVEFRDPFGAVIWLPQSITTQACAALPNLEPETSKQPVGASLAGLTPNRKYTVELVVETTSQTIKGAEEEFFTPAEAAPTVKAETVKGETATAVSESTAVIHGAVNPNGSVVSACEFEYSTTKPIPVGASRKACPKTAGDGSTEVPEAVTLTGLQPGVTYYYRLFVQYSKEGKTGSEKSQSEPGFTTSATRPEFFLVLNDQRLARGAPIDVTVEDAHFIGGLRGEEVDCYGGSLGGTLEAGGRAPESTSAKLTTGGFEGSGGGPCTSSLPIGGPTQTSLNLPWSLKFAAKAPANDEFALVNSAGGEAIVTFTFAGGAFKCKYGASSFKGTAKPSPLYLTLTPETLTLKSTAKECGRTMPKTLRFEAEFTVQSSQGIELEASR